LNLHVHCYFGNDHIKQEFNAPFGYSRRHDVKIFHRAIAWENGPLIAGIITIIFKRKNEKRVHPGHGYAQTFDIVELFDDAFDIPKTVAIGILETMGAVLV
jgi:hypothetical protein